MVPSYRVNFTLRAASQLEDIFDYIAKDSPRNAPKMIGRIVDAIDGLDIFPQRYKVLEDTATFGEMVRSMPVPPYLVRFQINESARVVTILSVRHGARQPGI